MDISKIAPDSNIDILEVLTLSFKYGIIPVMADNVDMCPSGDTMDLDQLLMLIDDDYSESTGKRIDTAVQTIEKHGIQCPVFLWRSREGEIVLDGSIRLQALSALRDSGRDIQDIPIHILHDSSYTRAHETMIEECSTNYTLEGLDAYVSIQTEQLRPGEPEQPAGDTDISTLPTLGLKSPKHYAMLQAYIDPEAPTYTNAAASYRSVYGDKDPHTSATCAHKIMTRSDMQRALEAVKDQLVQGSSDRLSHINQIALGQIGDTEHIVEYDKNGEIKGKKERTTYKSADAIRAAQLIDELTDEKAKRKVRTAVAENDLIQLAKSKYGISLRDAVRKIS